MSRIVSSMWKNWWHVVGTVFPLFTITKTISDFWFKHPCDPHIGLCGKWNTRCPTTVDCLDVTSMQETRVIIFQHFCCITLSLGQVWLWKTLLCTRWGWIGRKQNANRYLPYLAVPAFFRLLIVHWPLLFCCTQVQILGPPPLWLLGTALWEIQTRLLSMI